MIIMATVMYDVTWQLTLVKLSFYLNPHSRFPFDK